MLERDEYRAFIEDRSRLQRTHMSHARRRRVEVRGQHRHRSVLRHEVNDLPRRGGDGDGSDECRREPGVHQRNRRREEEVSAGARKAFSRVDARFKHQLRVCQALECTVATDVP